jgi:hypothetical protein
MADEAPYAVEAALRRHFEREAQSQLGVTLRALTSSDADRLTFWDGTRGIGDHRVQQRYIESEAERVVIEAAQRDGTLTPCIGYALTDIQYRPEESAWLLDREGNIIDPAYLRDVLGYFGVALRATEAANWTPTQPDRVTEGNVSRLAV